MGTCTCVLGTSLAESDGQTDGGRDRRICHHSIVLCMHSILTRDKKTAMLFVYVGSDGQSERCTETLLKTSVSYGVMDLQDAAFDFRLAMELSSNITRLLTVYRPHC